jgi:putative acetyltransferase
MVSIRRSDPREAAVLLEIWRRAVDATHSFLDPDDLEAIDAEVRKLLPAVPMWVAVDAGGRPLGFMILSENDIEAHFVEPSMHGKCIGRRLVEHARTLAGSLNVEVNEQNVQAVRFYEKLGFTRTGRSATDRQGRAYPLLHLRLNAKRVLS